MQLNKISRKNKKKIHLQWIKMKKKGSISRARKIQSSWAFKKRPKRMSLEQFTHLNFIFFKGLMICLLLFNLSL
jgi:hypothetical protein